MAEKKYASLSTLQTFLNNLKNTFATKTDVNAKLDSSKYVVDSALSSTSTNPVQNKVLDAEFDTIATSMNALEAAIDEKVDTATASSTYETKTDADTKLDTAKTYTDTKTSGLASTSSVTTSISTHNTSTTAHNDIRALITDLTTKLNNFLDVDDTTTDQLSEVITLINNNKGTLESLTSSKINVSDIVNNLTTNNSSKVLSAAQGVAIKGLIDDLQAELDSHTHDIADVSGLQTALNAKATQTNLDTHTGDTTKHITATERTNWNAAKTHADAAHAPSNAEKNQNAFSNIKVDSTTVAADTTTDTVEFVGSNVTITPDATNDKVTFAVADGSTSAKGIVQLTNSTSSTSTTTAATPNSVKSAYDLANTANTAAVNAQATADSKANATHSHAIAEVTDLQSSLDAKVPTSRTINGKALSSDITLTASDVGASTQNTWYGTCSTAANTAAKVVTTSTGNFSLVTGNIVYVLFTNAAYAGSTLNVDGTGAVTIKVSGTANVSTYQWGANEAVGFVYDGTNFRMLDGMIATTTYYGMTKLSSSTSSTSTTTAATPSAVKEAYDLAASKAGTSVATTTTDGLMSAADKTKLDGLGGSSEITSDDLPVVPITKGGTGATTAKEAEYNISGGMGESTAAIADSNKIIIMHGAASATNGVFVYKKASLLKDYIGAMPKSGGTFTGAVTAANDTAYTTYKVRNAAIVSATPSSMTNGTIAFVYS